MNSLFQSLLSLLKSRREVVTAVLVTAVVVGGGTYLLTKNSATTIVLNPEELAGARDGNPESGDEISGPPDTALCQDSDADEEEGGIYTWGEAISFRPGVPPSKGADACASETVLNEVQCFPSEKDKENALRVAEINCLGGCKDGACVKTAAETAPKTFTFSGPSPLTWEQNGVRISITGVALGKMPAPAELLRLDGGGESYAPGEKVYTLTLAAKIEALGSPECVRITPRRLLNEEGDLLAPNTRGFTFSDGTGCIPRANAAYADQKIIFVVPEGEREFALTTGGEANIFFTVSVNSEGALQVGIPSQEGG